MLALKLKLEAALREIALLPGVDVNIQNSFGHSPILYALKTNQLAVAKFLVSFTNIDFNLEDNSGLSFPQLLIQFGDLELLNLVKVIK